MLKVLCLVNKCGILFVVFGVLVFVIGVCVLVNYFMLGKVFEVLMGFVVLVLIINWVMISLIYLKFC